MKNKNSEIHPQLRFMAAFKPRLRLNRTSTELINRFLPWVIWPRSPKVDIENIWIEGQDGSPGCDCASTGQKRRQSARHALAARRRLRDRDA